MSARMVASIVMTMSCAGCGRLEFGRLGDEDGATAPGPFGPPTLIAGLSSAQTDSDPWVTSDGLELYFASRRAGGNDIYRSSRPAMGSPWDAPLLVAEVSDPSADDDAPRISPDGLTMYLSSDRVTPGTADIFTSTRPGPGSAWTTPVRNTELSTASHETGGSLSSDGLEIFFHSNRAGGLGTRDIYRATRASATAAFTDVVDVVTVNDTDYDGAPCITGDDRMLWFTSVRAGGVGSYDLWIATRASRDVVEFSAPQLVLELDTASSESDAWVSADQRWIVFTSDRAGDDDIYEARR